jgi:hypothetical protein
MARVGRDQALRNRTVGAVLGAARMTVRSFSRVIHQLWLEVTGLVFIMMALTGLGATIREYSKYHGGQAGGSRVLVASCFTLTFAWFGMTSFLRARRKSQRPQRSPGKI